MDHILLEDKAPHLLREQKYSPVEQERIRGIWRLAIPSKAEPDSDFIFGKDMSSWINTRKLIDRVSHNKLVKLYELLNLDLRWTINHPELPSWTYRQIRFYLAVREVHEWFIADCIGDHIEKEQLKERRKTFLDALLRPIDISLLKQNERQCHICLDEIGIPNAEGETEKPVQIRQCGHLFGERCIKSWALNPDNICPLCRGEILPIDHMHVAYINRKQRDLDLLNTNPSPSWILQLFSDDFELRENLDDGHEDGSVSDENNIAILDGAETRQEETLQGDQNDDPLDTE